MVALAMAAILPGLGCAPKGTSHRDLQTKLEERVEGFRGEVGVFAKHLESGEIVLLRDTSRIVYQHCVSAD
jgi:hypothetical protein